MPKISELQTATALTGQETLPLVQSGITKKATVEQLLDVAVLQSDLTLNVPSDYTSVASAMSFLEGKVFSPDIDVTIQIADGVLTPSTSTSLNHPFSSQISIVGNLASQASCVIRPTSAIDCFIKTDGLPFKRIAGITFDLAVKSPATTPGSAVLSLYGSHITVEDCTANNFYYSFAARSGATMRSVRCTSTNAGDVGFWAFTGAMHKAENCVAEDVIDVVNGLGFGFQAEYGSVMEAANCTASGCREAGFASLSNSTSRLQTCTSTGNTGGTGAGFMARDGGKIECLTSCVSGGVGALQNTYHIYVTEDGSIRGSLTNAGNVNAANAFVFLAQTAGQAQIASSTGPLRLDSQTFTYFNTANGLGVEISDPGTTITSRVYLQGGSAGTLDQAVIGVNATGANATLRFQTKGTGSYFFRTGGGTQFELLDTPGATNRIQITGSNGGNPVIQTTSGNLGLAAPLALTNQGIQSTIGAAGAAAALPTNPLGYLQTTINGTSVAIPYYTPA